MTHRAPFGRAGKALHIGVSEWNASEIRAAKALADELGVPLISNQPQYSMLWRVIEDGVVATSQELGLGLGPEQIVWSPSAQGVLIGKYLPGGPLPAGTRATNENSGTNFIRQLVTDQDLLERVQRLKVSGHSARLGWQRDPV